MSVIIELINVNKIYTGAVDTQVLFDINLSFDSGSCSAIVGESGSGKSSLLNIMGTLDKPTTGGVTISGIKIGDMNKYELADLRNESIGFVFQFSLFPESEY